ncbi:MAG: hypothetical protein GQ569_04760 [Methylococcaceae bacterium]|nr:hypothetical protein [Methylococcaceae bacterium]
MAIVELFSKRQKKLRGEFPDVYQYEEIPYEFRIQIVHIINDAIGANRPLSNSVNQIYSHIHKLLCKEYGVFTLNENTNNDKDAFLNFLIHEEKYEKCLDAIELSFNVILNMNMRIREGLLPTQSPKDAVNELNQRFKEWGVGYEFQNGQLIRIDSQFIHSETVKPVLILLDNEKSYSGTNQEFLKAHEHYRHKRYKECLVEYCKAFESLMKAICDKKGWVYDAKKDTASKLIKICFEKKLIPSYMDNQITSLKQLLESGVPTIRNKEAGHGQGVEISEVSEHLASYCLHLTASNLLFLANCEKELN